MNITAKVSEFTVLPGARHREDGDGSADQFFEEYIQSKLDRIIKNKDEKLLIDLDNTLGYASSFVSQLAIRVLEKCGSARKVQKNVIIKSDDDIYQEERFWNEVKQKK